MLSMDTVSRVPSCYHNCSDDIEELAEEEDTKADDSFDTDHDRNRTQQVFVSFEITWHHCNGYSFQNPYVLPQWLL